MVGGTGLEQHGTAAGGAKNSPVDCFLSAWLGEPRNRLAGMTAVKSLSFAQRKSEQNKIAIAKAGYHHDGGILAFCFDMFYQ